MALSTSMWLPGLSQSLSLLREWEREEESLGSTFLFKEDNLKATHITLAHLLLASALSHGQTQLNARLANLVLSMVTICLPNSGGIFSQK